MKASNLVLCAGTLLLGAVQGDSIQDVFDTMDKGPSMRVKRAPTDDILTRDINDIGFYLVDHLNGTGKTIPQNDGGTILHQDGYTIQYNTLGNKPVKTSVVLKDLPKLMDDLSVHLNKNKTFGFAYSQNFYVQYNFDTDTLDLNNGTLNVDTADDNELFANESSKYPAPKSAVLGDEGNTTADKTSEGIDTSRLLKRGNKKAGKNRRFKKGDKTLRRKVKSGKTLDHNPFKDFEFYGVPFDARRSNNRWTKLTMYNESKPGDWIYDNVNISIFADAETAKRNRDILLDFKHKLYDSDGTHNTTGLTVNPVPLEEPPALVARGTAPDIWASSLVYAGGPTGLCYQYCY
ncbi:hypothetical protein HDU86_007581 [Geranomyces michiganensis]|nr:hypothetical protein HDU86_007581 [Geranomyces michiganensis]